MRCGQHNFIFRLLWNRIPDLAGRQWKHLTHFCMYYIRISVCQITRSVEVTLFPCWTKWSGLSTVQIEGHDSASLLLNVNERRRKCGSEAALGSWISAYHSTWVMARSVPAQVIKCQKQTLILLGFLPNPVVFLPLVTAQLSNVSIAMRALALFLIPLFWCVLFKGRENGNGWENSQ